ncbi:MAG: hypothetical protein F4186_11975 [Boseongicola sp. SB0676_bin_33]|nr:hypothetical protein [Boseongicola sp. SB0676_bin_33]MYK32518.1 hypothetical protein [Boseongicola sp. SB0670_bin_30]
MSDTRLPVTVLSASLGAGKVTLPSRVLNDDGPRVAVLDACLVPAQAARGPDDLTDYPDPFPVWRRAAKAA